MKLDSKGRVSFTVDLIKELLNIPDEFQVAVVTYDKAFETITLVGYSEGSLENLTYSFKEADTKEDLHFDDIQKVRERLCGTNRQE